MWLRLVCSRVQLEFRVRHWAQLRVQTGGTPMKHPQRILPVLRVVTLAALALATACDKGESKDGGDEAVAAEKSAGPSAKAGKVTVERLETLDNDKILAEAADFDKCVAQAESQLGKASKVEGDDHTWSAVKGEECHSYVLMGANGTMKRSKGPYKVNDGDFEECKKTAG